MAAIRTCVFAVACAIGLTMLGTSRSALAHDHDCLHTHNEPFPDDVITCDDPGAICDEEDEKVCVTRQSRTRGWCECQKKKAGFNFLGRSQWSAGPPIEFGTVVYTTIDAPSNVWDVVHTQTQAPLLLLGPGGHDVQGTLTLEYGSFADPDAIPVTLTQLSITLPGMIVHGAPTGPSTLHLVPGETPPMLFDALTGFVDAGPGGFAVVIDNALGSWSDSRLRLQLEIQPLGAASLAQGITLFPEEIPSLSPRHVALLAALLLLCAAVVQRARMQQTS
ncbi:MAG TPA: hypothetical protein VFY49_15455 [Myxococcota bacterium]|nr:hypothetical protein [Myxococcota bacterium]